MGVAVDDLAGVDGLVIKLGQRYIHHRRGGGNILLFVRQRRLAEWGTAAYTLLGPAEYESHTGERPIQYVWRLKRAMPADFFRGARVATG